MRTVNELMMTRQPEETGQNFFTSSTTGKRISWADKKMRAVNEYGDGGARGGGSGGADLGAANGSSDEEDPTDDNQRLPKLTVYF